MEEMEEMEVITLVEVVEDMGMEHLGIKMLDLVEVVQVIDQEVKEL